MVSVIEAHNKHASQASLLLLLLRQVTLHCFRSKTKNNVQISIFKAGWIISRKWKNIQDMLQVIVHRKAAKAAVQAIALAHAREDPHWSYLPFTGMVQISI